MSSVELPRVASARSASSSASSSRGSTHSAGSANSERSHRSKQDADEEHEEDEDEEPQDSSGQGLWDEVEHFLSKPSPSFATLRGPSTKSRAKAAAGSKSGVLPTLNGRKAATDNQSVRPSRPARASGAAGSKAIDAELLQQAFAYAQRVHQLHLDEEDESAQQSAGRRGGRHKAPALARTRSSSSTLGSNHVAGPRVGHAGGKKPGSSSSSGSGGAESRKKGKMAMYSSAARPGGRQKKRGEAQSTPETRASAKSKGHMDPQTLQELVSNFQHGTTLDELRKELAASQQSMAASRQVLQDAAHSFFQAA